MAHVSYILRYCNDEYENNQIEEKDQFPHFGQMKQTNFIMKNYIIYDCTEYVDAGLICTKIENRESYLIYASIIAVAGHDVCSVYMIVQGTVMRPSLTSFFFRLKKRQAPTYDMESKIDTVQIVQSNKSTRSNGWVGD